MSDQHIQCRRCGEEKPRDEFYNLRHTTQPRMPCKECISVEKRARYAAAGGDRASHAQVLREKHNLTSAEYDRLLAAQDGLCAICRQEETARGRGGRPRRLAVDHDHRTGAVRQLLCHRCHQVTRAAEENPALLEAVRAYLLRHGPPER
ncbi:endonuclease domain-containing protein [Catenuloplanes japonicus]|uniref:endonuclease domain-containing protein n=1 Tax=Catenuloplanes japonicus TaxID=33876 RepID=UPI000B1C85D5|nr:endonuclease domain-containing protein [Catenuloplanes japonicus]